jgi:transposase InsO family protein
MPGVFLLVLEVPDLDIKEADKVLFELPVRPEPARLGFSPANLISNMLDIEGVTSVALMPRKISVACDNMVLRDDARIRRLICSLGAEFEVCEEWQRHARFLPAWMHVSAA